MRPGPRRLLTLLLKAGLSLALFLVLLEVALRVVRPFSASARSWLAAPQDAVDFDRAHSVPELLQMSVLGFHPFVAQGGFVTNSRGFRTEEYGPDKAPGTWRVVALGDSFTFASGGVPWGDLWTTRLRAQLQAASPRPVELINLGVPGIGPSFELRVWRQEGAALHPDLVLLGLFVGNDFTDERWSVEGGFFSRYGRASCAARLLRNLVRGPEPGRRAPVSPQLPPPGTHGGYPLEGYEQVFAQRAPFYSEEELARIETRHMSILDRSRPAEFEQLFARVGSVLRQLDNETKAVGARLGVVVIPARCQVNPADRAAALALAGRPESDFAWDAPQQRLAEFLQAEGIAFLDLAPDLRAAAASQTLYSHGDTHWSPAGNALVAERVAAWVGTQGWLSADSAAQASPRGTEDR